MTCVKEACKLRTLLREVRIVEQLTPLYGNQEKWYFSFKSTNALINQERVMCKTAKVIWTNKTLFKGQDFLSRNRLLTKDNPAQQNTQEILFALYVRYGTRWK